MQAASTLVGFDVVSVGMGGRGDRCLRGMCRWRQHRHIAPIDVVVDVRVDASDIGACGGARIRRVVVATLVVPGHAYADVAPTREGSGGLKDDDRLIVSSSACGRVSQGYQNTNGKMSRLFDSFCDIPCGSPSPRVSPYCL